MNQSDQLSNSRSTKFAYDREEANKPVRAIILVPDFGNTKNPSHNIGDATTHDNPLDIKLTRSMPAKLEEASGLARAIDLEVVEAFGVRVRNIRPSTLFGKGKIEEISAMIAGNEIGLAIIDHAISPVQQQNLEKTWDCKVLDRTALILEIFGERAQTREGRVQVELAHLNYQKGRLVRSWTHLERQRGGLGFIGGPGETQIEADRRMIRERITRLEIQLEKIQKTRSLHRAKRQKVPHPIVALVGYTNAGKSTLFNHITGAQVYAKDQLFATLDPTLRQLELPLGTKVIISDTVGFVSNLPTHLVAAFRATLEEVIEADLIVHVRDISDEESDVQSQDVYQVLGQLGINTNQHQRIIEAWNKIDLLDQEKFEAIDQLRTGQGGEREPILISSISGKGLDNLLAEIENRISGGQAIVEITLGVHDLGKLNWIYENTSVLERNDREDGSLSLKLRVSSKNAKALQTLQISN